LEEKKEVARLKNALLKTENERRDIQDTLDHKRNAHQAQLDERTGELLRAEETILDFEEQVKNLQITNRTLSKKSESLESELQERDNIHIRRTDDHVMSFELEDGCTEIDASREKHRREILELESKIDSLQLDHTLELSVAEEKVHKLQSCLESLQLSHTQKVSALEGKTITLQSDLESLKEDYAQLSTVEKANREKAINSQHSIDKQKVIKLQSELTDLQSAYREAQSLIADHNQMALQLEQKHNQEISKLQSDIDALKSSNSEYRKTIEEIHDQLNSMTSSQQELHTSNENHKQEVAKLRSELVDLQSAYHEAQSLIAGHDQVVLQVEKKRNEEVTKLQSDIHSLKCSNNEYRTTIEETHDQLNSMTSSQQELHTSNENHKKAVAKLRSELVDLQSAYHEAQSLVQVVLQLEKKRNEEVTKLQSHLDALKSSNNEYRITIGETHRRLNSSQQELLASNENHKQKIAKLQSELTDLQTAHRKAQSLIVDHSQVVLKLEERHNQKVADLELQVKQRKDDNTESLQIQISNLNQQLKLARDQTRAATDQLLPVQEQLRRAQEQLRMPQGMLELVHVQYNQMLFKLKDSYERDKTARIGTLEGVYRKDLRELKQSQIKAHEEITKHFNTFLNVTQQFVEKYRKKKWSKDDRDFAKSDEWCGYQLKEQDLRNAYLNLLSAETILNDNHKEKVSSITAESFENCTAPEIVLLNEFRTALEPLLSLCEAAPTAGTTS
jgi:chromosome segregation ATPase